MTNNYKDSFEVSGKKYHFFNLNKAVSAEELQRLPYSLKILLENLLRFHAKKKDIEALLARDSDHEIAYRPARVLMQDFTGVPAVVDLAAMRDAMVALKGDARKINPLVPVDLVIDHSVQVDYSGTNSSFKQNVDLEMDRNRERYEFLRWGQGAFENFRVVPPGTGICHQVNLEYLAKVVWSANIKGELVAYPDTVVGTDSHTTMINGLAVLGWGVGGIEAEAAMLGQPVSMNIPEVIGFKLTGKMKEGTTATDLVLTVTQMLRKKGVVNKFVEFYGDGLNHLPLADRATIANMAPEYGATCGFFPVDDETLKYLHISGRDEAEIELVEKYAKTQGMWRGDHEPVFTDTLSLDLADIVPSLAGPKRPQDRVALSEMVNVFDKELTSLKKKGGGRAKSSVNGYEVEDGSVVIAAITSCTNTSNPYVMVAAGLVAKKAAALGMKAKPWVKTSLAPGSKVVTEYLEQSGLQPALNQLGFNLVGYGCTTCIGNSGPIDAEIEKAIIENDLVVASILSGNRNFEGRVHPSVRANYLASPPLVVAYALAGSVNIDISKDQIADGIYLKDIWPTTSEIYEIVDKIVTRKMFQQKYQDVFKGDEAWQKVRLSEGLTYNWDDHSTYIKNPPYFQMHASSGNIKAAKLLASFGDSITTDHISPAGNIAKTSPAAEYLRAHKVEAADFNSYGARRGNHEIMMRGTFANTRIKNELLDGVEGGFASYNNEQMSIYDAAMRHMQDGTPLIVVAGQEYGTGSSRDWAAKGTRLLGVRAVIAESFERIHRSNLVGMGVLPLMFCNGITRSDLGLKGHESLDIIGLEGGINPRMELTLVINGAREIPLLCRIDTQEEVEYFQNGGILQYVLGNLAKSRAA